MNDDPKYYDQDGRECSLQTLCTREPGWAASRIRTMRAALEQAERQRDEARWLLRRCRVQIGTEGGADELVDEINAHLRDTGE